MLTESMEDYLEMIYRLFEERGYVRAIELAQALQVQPPSATRMIQKLDEEGFIRYERYRNISLTQRGLEIGRFLVWRDQVLRDFLVTLSGKNDVHDQVEGIEHYITPWTMGWIRNLVNFLRANPQHIHQVRQSQTDDYPGNEDLRELRAWNFRHPSTS
ncbi:MAG: transcriptional regulator MntR [Firmicutes bacterium]|nr:transcriptional regulator MntR [Bacillota bacterium]MCL5038866.1 transcriptional regulator MntR [Bacillota bacterium]